MNLGATVTRPRGVGRQPRRAALLAAIRKVLHKRCGASARLAVESRPPPPHHTSAAGGRYQKYSKSHACSQGVFPDWDPIKCRMSSSSLLDILHQVY